MITISIKRNAPLKTEDGGTEAFRKYIPLACRLTPASWTESEGFEDYRTGGERKARDGLMKMESYARESLVSYLKDGRLERIEEIAQKIRKLDYGIREISGFIHDPAVMKEEPDTVIYGKAGFDESEMRDRMNDSQRRKEDCLAELHAAYCEANLAAAYFSDYFSRKFCCYMKGVHTVDAAAELPQFNRVTVGSVLKPPSEKTEEEIRALVYGGENNESEN